MIYTENITTPAGTAKDNPQRTTLHVTKGLVYRVAFYFPPGSQGLLGVAVLDGLYQCWPSTPGVYFRSDDDTIRFEDMLVKEAAPFEFTVLTYNLDTEYEHLVSVRVGLVSKDVFLARFMPTKTHEYLADLLLRLATERQELELLQRELISDAPLEWQLKIVPVKDLDIL